MIVKHLETGITVTITKNNKGVQVVTAYTPAEWALFDMLNLRNWN